MFRDTGVAGSSVIQSRYLVRMNNLALRASSDPQGFDQVCAHWDGFEPEIQRELDNACDEVGEKRKYSAQDSIITPEVGVTCASNIAYLRRRLRVQS